jgi:DNA-binding NarL/FixJ family response regulator
MSLVPAVVLAAAPQGPGAASDSPTLTARQREVLQLVAQGLSNREIAARMDLSEPTIKNYVEEILLHLGGTQSRPRRGSGHKPWLDLIKELSAAADWHATRSRSGG